MSWGALPFWIYDLQYRHHEALMSGCMPSEWIPKWSQAVDAYNYRTLTYIEGYNG